MDMTKNKNKGFLTVGAVFLFSFMRIIAVTGYTQLGFRLYDTDEKAGLSNILFWILAAVYSVLLAGVIARFTNRNGQLSTVLCAALLLDPLMFSVQRSNAFLLVSALFMLFVLADTYEKSGFGRDVTFVLFAVISAVVLPLSKFSFIPVAAVLYFLPVFEGKNKTKSYIMVICAALSVAAGVLLGKLSSDRFGEPDKWLPFKTFESPVQSSPLIYYALALPSIVLTGYLFNVFYKKCRHKKKTDNNSNMDMLFNLVAVAAVFSFAASFFTERAAICALGVVTPLSFLAMLRRKNVAAEETMKEVNDFIQKHFFVIVVAVSAIYFISMCLLLRFYFQDCIAEYFIVNK